MELRIACVAGGTSGIGRNVVLSLLERGYHVLAVGKGAKHAQELNEQTERWQNTLLIECADLSKMDDATKIGELIERRWGKLDVLVNSAGTISGGGIEKERFSDWEHVLATNLDSLFTLTKACLPSLKKGDHPNIVNISSVCSLRPCASLSYSVSKAGTDMFTKVLARELAVYRIRVNAVNPGVVRSNLQYSAGLFSSEASYENWIEEMKRAHPLGEIGEPSDITNIVLFLTSNEAKWITGAIVSVDGGRAIA